MIYILYLIPFVLILVLWVKDDINKALYIIIVTELTMAASYLFFGVSPRNLFVPYAILLGIIKYFKDSSYKIKLPTLNSVIFFTVFAYYLWISIVQVFIHGYSIFDYRFHILLGKSFWYISSAFLIQYFITDENKLKKFINVVIIFCGISAIVGIFQVLVGGIFVDLRNLLQRSIPRWAAKRRIFGLQLYAIPFSYDMLMGAFLSFPIWKNIKSKKSYIKNWLLFLIIFWGLIFSIEKSAIGGFFIGILILAYFLKKRSILYFLITASLSVLLISNIDYLKRNYGFGRIMNIININNLLSFRKPLFTVGLRIVWNEPFGIGNERYEEYVKENSNKFDDISEWKRATLHGVHNHFLMNNLSFAGIAQY